MLAGEPGIGKTRTAHELAAHGEAEGARVLWGRCYQEEGAPPYWPWVQLFQSYVQEKDAEQLQSEMGPGAAEIAVIVPEVRERLSAVVSPPDLEPEQAPFRLFVSIVTFLKNAAQSQPLMLVLDDLHWADGSSLLLLQSLARQLARISLLLVCCYRDVELSRQHPLTETLAQLSRETVFHRELLRGLPPEDVRPFIEAVAGKEQSPRLAETIYVHTEGNPFFMTELVRLLADPGTSDSEKVSAPGAIRVPEGVREAIGQRLNRLSEQCNQTLTIASIIGREFTIELLDLLSEHLTEDQILGVLEEALVARIIDELPRAMGRYQFSHALIQETLAAEVSALRRGRLHQHIAEALEKLYEGKTEDHAAEIAYHLTQAGDGWRDEEAGALLAFSWGTVLGCSRLRGSDGLL